MEQPPNLYYSFGIRGRREVLLSLHYRISINNAFLYGYPGGLICSLAYTVCTCMYCMYRISISTRQCFEQGKLFSVNIAREVLKGVFPLFLFSLQREGGREGGCGNMEKRVRKHAILQEFWGVIHYSQAVFLAAFCATLGLLFRPFCALLN